jgi:ribose/xylose/arabinose/galactoside ABC-type transport system permease subunit
VVVLLGGLHGGFVGAINGFFIAYEGIPAFIVTLATLAVVRGIALLVTLATRFRYRLTACLPLSDARG